LSGVRVGSGSEPVSNGELRRGRRSLDWLRAADRFALRASIGGG